MAVQYLSSFGGCRAGAQLQCQGRVADRGAESLSGICFPSEEEELSQFSGRIKLKELTDAPEAGEKEVYVYGFRENLKRPELYDLAMEKRFAGILADFKPDLVHIFGK